MRSVIAASPNSARERAWQMKDSPAMRRIAPRVGDAESAVVDPPTRTLSAFTEDGEPPAKASSDQLLSRSHDKLEPTALSVS
jgi:hypothetical protein